MAAVTFSPALESRWQGSRSPHRRLSVYEFVRNSLWVAAQSGHQSSSGSPSARSSSSRPLVAEAVADAVQLLRVDVHRTSAAPPQPRTRR